MVRRNTLTGWRMLAGLLLVALPAVHAAADDFAIGDAVQVREGDTWSAATVTGHEGRKFHIHYTNADASSDEWVTTDRMRKPGDHAADHAAGDHTAGGAGTPPGDADAAADKGAGDDEPGSGAVHPQFKPAQQIQVKWGGLWRAATVIKTSGDWTMVRYENGLYEWVQPWRMRSKTSQQDTTRDSSPGKFVNKNDPPPADPPSDQSYNPAAPVNKPRPARSPRVPRAGKNDEAVPAGTTPSPDKDSIHISETNGPGNIAMSRPDLTAGRDIEATQMEIRPVDDPAPSAPAPRMISLNHNAPKPGVVSQMIVNPMGRYLLMAFWQPFGDDPVNVQRVDCARGDAGKVLPLTSHVRPLAISPDGKRCLTRSEKTLVTTRWRLDLWEISDDDAPRIMMSFRAYDAEDNGGDAIVWAEFVDDDHVMTCSARHTITLWQLTDTAHEVYTLQADGNIYPELSPGRKYLTAGIGTKVMLYEALSGKCAVSVSHLDQVPDMVSAVLPDLKLMALAGHHRLVVHDLDADRRLLDIGLPPQIPGRTVEWINSNLLLIDHLLVFDLLKKRFVWQYTLPQTDELPIAFFLRDRMWFCPTAGGGFAGGSGRMLVNSFPLPPAEMVLADQRAPMGVLLLDTGSRVSLEVSAGSGEMHQKIVDHLTEYLQEAGITVADGQPVKLVAEVKVIDQHQVTYRMQDNREDSVTISDTLARLAYVHNTDGKTLWEDSSMEHGSAPWFIQVKKGQSASEVVNQGKPLPEEWFLTATFPRMALAISEPADTAPFGIVGGRTRNAK